jgi:hypothetical protein
MATVSPIRTLPDCTPTKPVDMMSGHISTCLSVRSSGTGTRFASASETSRYSAWPPSIVLPKRQPHVGLHPCAVPAPSWPCWPHRQAMDIPEGTPGYGELRVGRLVRLAEIIRLSILSGRSR